MLISALMLMATSVSLSEILGMGAGAVGGTPPRDLNRIKSEAFSIFQNANLFSAFCFYIWAHNSLSKNHNPLKTHRLTSRAMAR